MSLKSNVAAKGRPRNILLIGSEEETVDFLKRFTKFWKCSDPPPPPNNNAKEKKDKLKSVQLDKEIIKNYCTAFDEQLCFIMGIPTLIKYSEIRDFYETLMNVRVIDAILVLTDEKFPRLEWCLQFFFAESSFPGEKIVFIVNGKQTEGFNVNIMATMINLEDKLRRLRMATRLFRKKNLFTIEDCFCSNGMMTFYYRLCEIFLLEPCGIQFNTGIQNLFDTITAVNSILLEVLRIRAVRDFKSFTKITTTNFRNTICKSCSSKTYRIISCHSFCQCLDDVLELENCSTFTSKICQGACGCPVEAHVSLKYSIHNEINPTFVTFSENERGPILHMLATLYTFCKQRGEFSPIYRDFKKEYWSLAALSNITTDNPVFKEIEDKIKELEPIKPTLDEIHHFLERLGNTTWYSFDVKEIIKTKCEVRIIANTAAAPPPNLANTARVTQLNSQRPIRFPEMKSKLPPSRGDTTKELVEGEKGALKNPRKELELSINREKSAEESTQVR